MVHHAPVPELALGALPAGTHVLVMTHDHAEDFALCDAALRCGHLGSIGLIGSAAKWARFRSGLLVEGHDEATVARIECPIGDRLPGRQVAAGDRAGGRGGAGTPLRRRPRPGRRMTAAGGPLPRPAPSTPPTTPSPTGPRPGLPIRRRPRPRSSRPTGVITARGPFAPVAAAHPAATVIDLRGGILLPGLVDTHVHFPQVRVIGALGMPLLEWLERCALPEEAAPGRPGVRRHGRRRVRRRPGRRPAPRPRWSSGPTSPRPWTRSSPRPRASGCGSPAGWWSATGCCPEPLLTTPERAYDEARGAGVALARPGRARYAVTPRFSLSASDALLAACAAVLADVDGRLVHLARQREPRRGGRGRAACSRPLATTSTPTTSTGCSGTAAVLAHNVHPPTPSSTCWPRAGAAVAHCPTSNSALGQRAVPAAAARRGRRAGGAGLRRRRRHRVLAVQGGAAGLLRAAAARRRRAPAGAAPTCCTWPPRPGAAALGLGDVVGDLSVGKEFDAVWLRPPAGTALDIGLRHAGSPEEALAKAFALAGDADVADVWVAGEQVASGGFLRPVGSRGRPGSVAEQLGALGGEQHGADQRGPLAELGGHDRGRRDRVEGVAAQSDARRARAAAHRRAPCRRPPPPGPG